MNCFFKTHWFHSLLNRESVLKLINNNNNNNNNFLFQYLLWTFLWWTRISGTTQSKYVLGGKSLYHDKMKEFFFSFHSLRKMNCIIYSFKLMCNANQSFTSFLSFVVFDNMSLFYCIIKTLIISDTYRLGTLSLTPWPWPPPRGGNDVCLVFSWNWQY